MFETLNQLSVFIKCIGLGGACGVLFLLNNGIKTLINNKIISIILDVCSFFLSALIYLICSYKMQFPSLRLYMIMGFYVGIYLYYKSFNFILAKILKKPYNIIKGKIQKILNDKRKAKDDRIKAKKNHIRSHRRGSAIVGDIGFGNGLSVNIHKR